MLLCKRVGVLALLALLGMAAQAAVRLPAVLGDGMVLQRDHPIAIWGVARPGEAVTVSLRKAQQRAVAGADGQWAVTLPAMTAGGPYTMTVVGENTLTVTNILIGEVWVCAGQSNMEWPVINTNAADAEIAAADYPAIHLYYPPKTPSLVPLPETAGHWAVCAPATVPQFSAVGYFFAREIARREKVPIGMINAAQGGSTAEQWTPPATLKTLPDFAPVLAKRAAQWPDFAQRQQELLTQRLAWQQATRAIDAGYRAHWFDPATAVTDWKTMDLPRWMDGEMYQYLGVVWFRRDIEVPAEMAGRPLDLALGPVDDADITWVNGVPVGETMADGCYAQPRLYQLPAGLVHAGRNTVVVRVLNRGYGGGLPGYRTELRLVTRDTPVRALSLAGPWSYRIGFALKDAPPVTFALDTGPGDLYNGIIAPLTRYPIRGVLWYQGESNVGRAGQYRTLLTAMIRSWRTAWGVGDFPFFIVQLPNLGKTNAEPTESAMAEFREAQQQVTAEPHTGLIVTIDVGDPALLHPLNKQDVGLRLALLAARDVYGQRVIAAGPVFRDLRVDGANLRVRFTSPGGLAVRGGGALTGFAIAGEDRKFAWATAVIAGDTVILAAPTVPHPIAVRYNWDDAPRGNLINPAGLPAMPFRTDSWGRK